MKDIQKEDVKYEEKESIKENGDVSVENGHSTENGFKANDLDRNTNNLSKMVTMKKREPTEGSDGEEDCITKNGTVSSIDDLSQQIESLSLVKNEKIDTCPEPQVQIKKEAAESEDQDDGKKPLNTRGPMGGVPRTVLPKAYEMNFGTVYHTSQAGKRRIDEGESQYYKYNRPGDGNFQQDYPVYSQQNDFPQTANYNQRMWEPMQQPFYQEYVQAPNNFSGGTVTIKSPTTDMAQNPLESNFADDIIEMAADTRLHQNMTNNCSVLSNQLKTNNVYQNQINLNQTDYSSKYQNGGLEDKMAFPYQQHLSRCTVDMKRDNQILNNAAGTTVPPGFTPQLNGYSLSPDNRNETVQDNGPQVNNFTQVQKPEKRDSYLSESESDIERSPYSFQSHSPGSVSMNSLSSPPPSNLSGDSGIGGLDVGSPLQQDMYQSTFPGKPLSNAGTSPPRDMFTPPTPEPTGFSTIKNDLLDNAVCLQSENLGADQISLFLNSHLPELKDVLDVIGQDIMRDNKKKHPSDSESSESGNLPPSPGSKSQPLSPPGPSSVAVSPVSPSISANKPIAPASQITSLNFSPQQSVQANLPSPSVGNNGIPVSGTQMVFLPPPTVSSTGLTNTPQVPPTTSTFVVLPPGNLPPMTVTAPMPLGTGQQPSTIIIVAPPMAPQQKQKPKGPRKIAPKIPSTSSQTEKNKTNVITNTAGPKASTVTTQAAGKVRSAVTSSGGPKPVIVPPRVNNLLNVARRMVAEISRENLPFQDYEGDTYLHVAVCRTDPNMVQALLERLMREELQGMVDVENNKRQTPLYIAVADNQAQMVSMFVKCNANPNAMAQVMSTDGRTVEVKAPIHVASSSGHHYLRTLQELLKALDISLNIANSDGHTALHCAILAHGRPLREGVFIDSIPVIEMLLKAGIDANCQDKKCGKTPLMYAIEKKDTLLVEALLRMFDKTKLRIYIRSQTFDGRTCQKIAEGLKQDFHPEQWNKLWNLLDNACNGELPLIQLPYRQL